MRDTSRATDGFSATLSTMGMAHRAAASRRASAHPQRCRERGIAAIRALEAAQF
jgi:hypothetical protein